jgi:CHAT domain-containing protein
LGELLRGPLADVRASKRLLIVAEGKLAQVPFAAIQAADREGAAPSVLAETWQISMLPSGQAGLQWRQRALDGRPVARGAGRSGVQRRRRASTGRAHGAASLSQICTPGFLTAEAEAILALKPSRSDLKAVDFDANVETARRALGAYRYVHFSTHAEADAAHPELSGKVISLVDRAGKERDGILELPAILEMPVRARLVVLSACDTVTGREIPMEGILGLTQAFLYAGAQQVISSAWPVDDFVAHQFMARFYEALLVRGMPPAAAVRSAQLSMMRTKAFAEPAKWAAFAAYGFP